MQTTIQSNILYQQMHLLNNKRLQYNHPNKYLIFTIVLFIIQFCSQPSFRLILAFTLQIIHETLLYSKFTTEITSNFLKIKYTQMSIKDQNSCTITNLFSIQPSQTIYRESTHKTLHKQTRPKAKTNGEFTFDLDPEWKSKHLAYQIKPKISQNINNLNLVLKQSRQTKTTQNSKSVKSANDISDQYTSSTSEIDNLLTSFKGNYTLLEQRFFNGHNTCQIIEPNKAKSCVPLLMIKLSSADSNQNKPAKNQAQVVKLQSQQHLQSEQKSTTKYFNQYSSKQCAQCRGKPSLKPSSFQKLVDSEETQKNKSKNQKKCKFTNMKVVQSIAAESDQEQLGQSIVITKCMPSKLSLTAAKMFKSQVYDPQLKNPKVDDNTSRRKTTGDIRIFLQTKDSNFD